MNSIRSFVALLLGTLVVTGVASAAAPAPPATHVLLVVGPATHPPGSHEVAAGARLLQHCLEHMANVPNVKADVFYEWPPDKAVRDTASTIVFTGDQFPPLRLPDPARNMADLQEMMARGCGLVCIHYATGLAAEDVAPDGEHPLLHWLGGYFAMRCPHHQSIAKIYPAATITPAAPHHPVSHGWHEFTLMDEPYTNNYFGKDGNQPAANVTIFATSMLPPENPQREAVAWGVDRPDGGRGFGIVMPHFYHNWKLEDLRRFILNGIVWTAKREVPADGVATTLPSLADFQPAALEPATPAPKP
jgi:type 1 glutamine amidotransferase